MKKLNYNEIKGIIKEGYYQECECRYSAYELLFTLDREYLFVKATDNTDYMEAFFKIPTEDITGISKKEFEKTLNSYLYYANFEPMELTYEYEVSFGRGFKKLPITLDINPLYVTEHDIKVQLFYDWNIGRQITKYRFVDAY